jgi:hypothetical protein
LGLIAKVAEAASATFPEKQPSATTVSAERKFLTISPPKPLLNKKPLELLHGSQAVARLRGQLAQAYVRRSCPFMLLEMTPAALRNSDCVRLRVLCCISVHWVVD